MALTLKGQLDDNENFYALTHNRKQLELNLLFIQMAETHNYAMNLIVPLMGIAPLLMLFILKGEKKSKSRKTWTRSTN